MNIYDFAYEMESESENYYSELAEDCNTVGLKKILLMLAEEEKKHKYIVMKMKTDEKADFTDSTILKDVKNIFIEIRDKKEKIDEKLKQKNLYIKAQELERKSEEFYQEKAKESENNEEKKIFLKLSKEERRHYFLLENIIVLLSRPEEWVENGEFNHLDDEY